MNYSGNYSQHDCRAHATADGARFWMVWNLDDRSPRVKYCERHYALTEAERLARANPSKSFYVVCATALARVEPTPVAIHELVKK